MSDILLMSLSEKRKCLDNSDKDNEKRQQIHMKRVLPEKKFLERNSPLTDLFNISHIRTVYNIIMVTFILLFLDIAVKDITESGTLLFGTVTLRVSFAKLPICLCTWLFMKILTFAVYVGVNFWSYNRQQCSSKPVARKLWDYGCLISFIVYQVFFTVFFNRVMIRENLGIACNVIILVEQLRMLMKTHAFVRSVVPRFLSYKPHNDDSRPNGPRFSQYLYFLFAPTLVYRDEYPRTKKIRWTFVFRHFAEVGLVILYFAFILERFVTPVFRIFGTRPLEPTWFAKSILEASIPGIFCFIFTNYLLLHAWMNAWAEMLRFADRSFYEDWWNCTSYREYYRTWNVVVHDWLYTYIYKDTYETLVPGNKTLAAVAVFLVSAVFHEYIITFMLSFFYPVMFVLFGGLGSSLVFVGRMASSNIFMWFSFFIGNGLMFSAYTMELYARFNCPPYSNYFLDLFVPRSWTCQAQFVE